MNSQKVGMMLMNSPVDGGNDTCSMKLRHGKRGDDIKTG